MATERMTPLQRIFKRIKMDTPEYKAEQERLIEERRLREEERIQREGEVKVLLFDEYEIYNKKRYRAKVPQLLEFLKQDENAVTFWENQHIRKLYDISNEINFFSSIYTEETKDSDYEQLLRRGLCNPFNNNYVINYECIARIREAHRFNITAMLNEIIGFCEGTCYVTESKLLEGHPPDFSRLYVDAMYMKARKYGDLLDKNETVSRLPRSNDEETVYILNPLFITENHFLRLDAYDVWRKSRFHAMKYEWTLIEKKAPYMIQVLDELARSRRVYLNEVKKRKNK